MSVKIAVFPFRLVDLLGCEKSAFGKDRMSSGVFWGSHILRRSRRLAKICFCRVCSGCRNATSGAIVSASVLPEKAFVTFDHLLQLIPVSPTCVHIFCDLTLNGIRDKIAALLNYCQVKTTVDVNL